MNDVILRYVDLPSAIHGYTLTDSNDDYNVYINANIGIAAQEKAKDHELRHIGYNHFHDTKSAANNEKEVKYGI